MWLTGKSALLCWRLFLGPGRSTIFGSWLKMYWQQGSCLVSVDFACQEISPNASLQVMSKLGRQWSLNSQARCLFCRQSWFPFLKLTPYWLIMMMITVTMTVTIMMTGLNAFSLRQKPLLSVEAQQPDEYQRRREESTIWCRNFCETKSEEGKAADREKTRLHQARYRLVVFILKNSEFIECK